MSQSSGEGCGMELPSRSAEVTLHKCPLLAFICREGIKGLGTKSDSKTSRAAWALLTPAPVLYGMICILHRHCCFYWGHFFYQSSIAQTAHNESSLLQDITDLFFSCSLSSCPSAPPLSCLDPSNSHSFFLLFLETSKSPLNTGNINQKDSFC